MHRAETTHSGQFASIGPRLFSRGKQWWVECNLTSDLLQLGRGFSAAESNNQAIDTTDQTRLQLGRGFSAAERQPLATGSPLWVWASIGPRLFSRGKVVAQLLIILLSRCFNWAAAFQPRKAMQGGYIRMSVFTASIGPRLFSRGKLARLWGLLPSGKLQLGRGFSAAERANRTDDSEALEPSARSQLRSCTSWKSAIVHICMIYTLHHHSHHGAKIPNHSLDSRLNRPRSAL